MSTFGEDLLEIYAKNPATSLQPTDILYGIRSPYGEESDFGIQAQNLVVATSGGLTWNTITGAATDLLSNNGYIINRPSLVMLSLPTISQVGDIITVLALGSGGFQIAQNPGQNILMGQVSTTTGTAGTLQSQEIGDCLTLVCTIADSMWFVQSMIGNIIFV